MILQCGDYGWWPALHGKPAFIFNGWGKKPKKWDQFGVKNHLQGGKTVLVYWCPGNHEDWWDLKHEKGYISGPIEVQPGVFYMQRGEILRLPDGRNILFMGGAESIDKDLRVMGRDWFPEEIITQADIETLPDPDEVGIDIVISHTCPREFHDEIFKVEKSSRIRAKFEDPSMLALSYILHTYRPGMWFFGHFHLVKNGTYNNTKWFCLLMAPYSGWWMELPED